MALMMTSPCEAVRIFTQTLQWSNGNYPKLVMLNEPSYSRGAARCRAFCAGAARLRAGDARHSSSEQIRPCRVVVLHLCIVQGRVLLAHVGGVLVA